MSKNQKRLECFGTATFQDACSQCPDNEDCVKETMRRMKIPEQTRVLETKIMSEREYPELKGDMK